jgi:hypothetical protein
VLTTLGVPERRRSRRVPVGAGCTLALPSTWSVQLLDVSLGGMSFSSPHDISTGRTVSVRATLAREPFSGQLRVCWSRSLGPATSFEIGATFLPLDDGSRRALRAFLKLPPSEREMTHAD